MIKKIGLGVILFILFYLEPLEFAGLKFAIIWKIPLMLFLSIGYFKIIKDLKFSKYSFFYSVKYLLNSGLFFFGYYSDSFFLFFRNLNIPLFFSFFLKSKNFQTIYSILNFLSNFVIVSAIPFVFNLLQPISSGYSLEDYGFSEEGFVGIFQNPHGASIVLAQCMIFKFFQILNISKIKKINYFYFVFSFFPLYLTFVRTAYLMVFFGFSMILWFKFWNRNKILFVSVYLGICLCILFLYSNNDIIQARFNQNYANSDTEFSLDKFSSGRLNLSAVNLNNFFRSNVFYQFFGLGSSYSMDLMEEDIGLRKNSHNGFVDALVHNGYIGFFFFIMMLIYLLYYLLKFKSNYFPLGISSYFSFLFFHFLQGGNFFLYEILFVLCICLSILNYSKQNQFP